MKTTHFLTIDYSKMIEDLERYWCVAIRHGEKAEWEKAWEASLSNQWLTHRTKILSAMSCSKDPNRLQQLLTRVFDLAVYHNPNDTFITIGKMAENPVGRSMALNFIRNHWDILRNSITA